jgi:hypothetical protein
MQNNQDQQHLITAFNLGLNLDNEAQEMQDAEDCQIPHPIYQGYSLEYSSDPHADRYEEYCIIC